MLKEVSCNPLPNDYLQSQGSAPFEPKPGKPIFFIKAWFQFTWVATLDDLTEGEELSENDEDSMVTINVPNLEFCLEQRRVLDEYQGPPMVSHLMSSFMGLPRLDHATIVDKILSCARGLAHGPTPAKILCMDLNVSCHLENPDEARAVKDAIYQIYGPKALKRVKVDQEGQGGQEVNKCSICLEDMVSGTVATTLPCSHVFHHSCIAPWLLEGASSSCPLCRFDPVLNTCGDMKVITFNFGDD